MCWLSTKPLAGRIYHWLTDDDDEFAVNDAREWREEHGSTHWGRAFRGLTGFRVERRERAMCAISYAGYTDIGHWPGDRVLLCTDGLHDAVDDASLAAVLFAHPDPTKACAALIDTANQAGGPNNITALVINIPAVAAEA